MADELDKKWKHQSWRGGIPPFTTKEKDPIAIKEKDPTGKDQHEPGAKLDNGKVKAGVLEDFSLALWEVARVGSNGADKYTRHGWESVPNGIERYKDAKWRHLLKGVRTPTDPEWDILHLAHECWNNLAKLELILRKELG